jgi:hypothetical protein
MKINVEVSGVRIKTKKFEKMWIKWKGFKNADIDLPDALMTDMAKSSDEIELNYDEPGCYNNYVEGEEGIVIDLSEIPDDVKLIRIFKD